MSASAGKYPAGCCSWPWSNIPCELDRVLAVASDTWDVSAGTLADELGTIERVGALLKQKADFISDKKRGSAQPMIEGLEAIVAQYRALIGRRPASDSDSTWPAVRCLNAAPG